MPCAYLLLTDTVHFEFHGFVILDGYLWEHSIILRTVCQYFLFRVRRWYRTAEKIFIPKHSLAKYVCICYNVIKVRKVPDSLYFIVRTSFERRSM